MRKEDLSAGKEDSTAGKKPGLTINNKQRSILDDSREVVVALRSHYEAIIRDMMIEIREKDKEIARLKNNSSSATHRPCPEDDLPANEPSTRVATREEDCRPFETETEKLKSQLAETMEMLSSYRDKYYRAMSDVDKLEDRLRAVEKPASRKSSKQRPRPNMRKTPSVDHVKNTQTVPFHRPAYSANSSSIAYLVPEPEAPICMSPVALSPVCLTSHSPVVRKTASRPKTRYECRSYIPSFTRMRKEKQGGVREEQTDPVRASYQVETMRPDSRFADEFPEENELE